MKKPLIERGFFLGIHYAYRQLNTFGQQPDEPAVVDLLLGVQLTLTGDIDPREVLLVHGLKRLT